jgi:hypothetical protein
LIIFFVVGEASFAFGAPHLFEISEPATNTLGKLLRALLAGVVETAVVNPNAVRTQHFAVIINVQFTLWDFKLDTPTGNYL